MAAFIYPCLAGMDRCQAQKAAGASVQNAEAAPNPEADAKPKLRGLIERRTGTTRFERPGQNPDPDRSSLFLIPVGANSNVALNGQLQHLTDPPSLSDILSAGNFNLPFTPRQPIQDNNSLPIRARITPLTTFSPADFYIRPALSTRVVAGPGSRSPAPDPLLQCFWTLPRQSTVSASVFAQSTQANLLNQPRYAPANYLNPANFTNVPPPPRPVSPPPPPPPAQPVRELEVYWDAWYNKVAAALYSEWSGNKGVEGRARLRITVDSGRHMSADIISLTGGSTFQSRLFKSVARVDHSDVLAFPSGTRRSSVTFDVDFDVATTASGGYESLSTGDCEHVRSPR
jgi:hypothetical protein